MKVTTLKKLIQEELKDGEFKFYYEQEKDVSQLSQMIHYLRMFSGMTQEELAIKAKTTQPVIARLESGKDSRIPSLDLLNRIAHAANKRISIKFEDL